MAEGAEEAEMMDGDDAGAVGASGGAALELRIGPARAGERLDRVLAAELGASRAEVRRLLARGEVELDGQPLDAGAKGLFLDDGACIRVARFTAPEARRPVPEPDAPLTVLARGDGWVALDKPAGVAVHPLREDETGTLLNALAAREPAVVGVGEGALRSGVVHRLDVDTSGIVVMATRDDRWQRLRAAFREHRISKRYVALVAGQVEIELGLQLPLVVAQHKPARVRVVEHERAAALGATQTRQRVRPLERLEDATFVEVDLETGFLHQIRATLAHVGHPVLGDPIYAEAAASDAASRAPRQMLHAQSIVFDDIAAESPLPDDFSEVLARLRR